MSRRRERDRLEALWLLEKRLDQFILAAEPSDNLRGSPIAVELANLSSYSRDEIINFRWGDRPLFLATKRGLVNIVVYLLDALEACTEIRGRYVTEDGSVDFVTPLWLAAKDGNLEILKVLVGKGANVNAATYSGSTAIRATCYLSRFEVVEYLLLHGADLNRATHEGGTCLMSSTQSPSLCEFLLSNGAKVDARDSRHKTALLYAIQKDNLETVKVLLKHRADHTLQSEFGDDALQTACLWARGEIAEYLIENLSYHPRRIADAYELLGAAYIEELCDITRGIDYWERAVRYRENEGIAKDVSFPTHPIYMGLVPFQTSEEIRSLSLNIDHVRAQCLMIGERVLGTMHTITIYALMLRAEIFADRLMYDEAINVWKYVLDIRLQKDTVLDSDTCELFETLTDMLFNRYEDPSAQQRVDGARTFNEVLFLFKKCIDAFPYAIEELNIRPTKEQHQETWDRLVEALAHLLYLAAMVSKTEEQEAELHRYLRRINEIAPKTIKGDSLLHFTVDKRELPDFRSRNPIHELRPIFPDLLSTKWLLRTGAVVDAPNAEGTTPLHVACMKDNYSLALVQMLLEAGAHIDRANYRRDRPIPLMLRRRDKNGKINIFEAITLKCLAATVVKREEIGYGAQVPEVLQWFIDMH